MDVAVPRCITPYLSWHSAVQSTSSATKGETLSDTMRCLQCYSDVVVLRHPSQGSAAVASAALGTRTVLLNAGDGVGEHPTQALLDLATMQQDWACAWGGGGGARRPHCHVCGRFKAQGAPCTPSRASSRHAGA